MEIGRLGRLVLRRGHYVYAGSALGPGGLGARLRRHLVVEKPLHWHIDYLRAALAVVEIWYTLDHERREHQWAAAFVAARPTSVPLKGFGASDCDCTAHLFFSTALPSVRGFRARLARRVPDHGPVMCHRLSRD